MGGGGFRVLTTAAFMIRAPSMCSFRLYHLARAASFSVYSTLMARPPHLKHTPSGRDLNATASTCLPPFAYKRTDGAEPVWLYDRCAQVPTLRTKHSPPVTQPVLRVFEANETSGRVVVVHSPNHGLHFSQIHGAVTLVRDSPRVDSTQRGDPSLLVIMDVAVGSQNHFTATNLKALSVSAAQPETTERN